MSVEMIASFWGGCSDSRVDPHEHPGPAARHGAGGSTNQRLARRIQRTSRTHGELEGLLEGLRGAITGRPAAR